MADDVNIRFGATIDDLKSKLGLIGELFRGIAQGAQAELAGRASASMNDLNKNTAAAAKGVGDQMSAISSSFRSLLATLGVTVSVGAFVSMIKGSIDAADHLNDLSQKTGIAASTLGGIGFAATQAGGTLDSAAAAIGKLSKTVAAAAAGNKEAAEPFKAMGIEVTDAAGKTKAADVILGEVAARFETYADGPEKTALAMKLFGRAGADLIPMLNEGKKALEENTEYYKKYGGVTDETAKQADQFNDTAGKISFVMGGFARTLSAALLLMLQALAEAFLESREKGGLLAGAVDLIKVAFEAIVVFGANVIYTLGVVGRSLAAVAAGMMALKDFNLEGVHQIRVQLDLDNEKAKRDLDKFEAGVMGGGKVDGGTNLFANDKPKPKDKPNAPRLSGGADDSAAKQAAKTDSARLALGKAENEADLSLQREYLKQAQSIYDGAYKDGLLSIKEFYDAKLAIELKGIEASLEAKRRDLAEANTAAGKAGKEEEKLKFMAQAAKLQGEINVLTAQEANAVRVNTDAREDAERKLASELATLDANSAKAKSEHEIEMARKTGDQELALGRIDAEQAFQMARQFEQRDYEATKTALAAKRALLQGGVGPQAQKEEKSQYAQEEAAKRQHEKRMTEIELAAERERTKYSIQAQGSIKSSFATMVGDLLSGTKKIGDVFRDFGRSIATTFTNLIAQKFTDSLFNVTGVKQAMDKAVNFVTDGIAKMFAKKAANKVAEEGLELAGAAVTAGAETAKTGAVVAGAALRTGAEISASATSKSLTLGDAIMTIGAKAWEAAASVFAAVAQIPYVGWILAPALALAAGATVIGFISNIASSAGGEYNVAEDRLNLVHKNETILPAHFAEGLRNLIAGGGAPAMAVGGYALPALPSRPEAAQREQQQSPVGQMVMRWQNGEQGAGAGNMGDAMRKLQGLQAGEAQNAGWRLPANPLARIMAGPTADPGAGGAPGGGRRGGAGVVVNETSSSEFFIANRKQLLKALGAAGRDNSR